MCTIGIYVYIGAYIALYFWERQLKHQAVSQSLKGCWV